MRVIKNALYVVTHSYVVLGSMAGAFFSAVFFLGFGHRGTQARSLLYDPRGAAWCALAIAAAVIVYDEENRIPTAAVSRGNERVAYYLSRVLVCHLLTACVYALSVCGAAIWLKSPLTKDFLAELMKTLPFCFAATALVLLLAVVLHSMMAFITMAVLFVFALWNGLGANVEWFYSVFPPYLQMNDSRTVLNYVVCIAWVLGTLPIFLIIAYHREMK
ncbi:MAG: hypothetical protein HFH05_10705 [Lachnospiraceae bacterium]|nr:hypothetical protein [Lachnospiraceae bacterium]